jgi:hypothetical protein
VYSVTAAGVKREFFEEMDKRGVKDLKWIGNDAISYVAYSYESPLETSRVREREAGANGSARWRIESVRNFVCEA